MAATSKYSEDITGWDAPNVVELLESIVNGKKGPYCKTSVFEFKIQPPEESTASRFFQLRPNPSDKHPGNGMISYLEKKGENITKKQHDYKKLNDWLKQTYTSKKGEDFARDIKKVFKNNKEIYNVPPATAEAYMILLFEIGRRLKEASTSPFDKLPIESAIAKLVKLLEARKCSLEDVFSKQGKSHCFSGECSQRETAIGEINKEYHESFPNVSEQPSLMLLCKDGDDQIEQLAMSELSLEDKQPE